MLTGYWRIPLGTGGLWPVAGGSGGAEDPDTQLGYSKANSAHCLVWAFVLEHSH